MHRIFVTSAALLMLCAAQSGQTLREDAAAEAMEGRIKNTVKKLTTLRSNWPAGENHEGERHVWQFAQLEEAAVWIEAEFARYGYEVRREEYVVTRTGAPLRVRNVIAELPGRDPKNEILIVGAHYDTRVAMPTPRAHHPPQPANTGTPGANDNASGVAAMLELARQMAGKPQQRTLRFVAFVNEEPPFFQKDDMGSVVHARGCKARLENIVGMISLETLGYYTMAPASQKYPFPNLRRYPKSGDFVSFISNAGSDEFAEKAAAHYPVREPGGPVPRVIQISFPVLVKQIAWSDDWSFSSQGYPSFCVTDTAHQRYAFYHLPGDTMEKLDYVRLAGVTRGLVLVIKGICNPAS